MEIFFKACTRFFTNLQVTSIGRTFPQCKITPTEPLEYVIREILTIVIEVLESPETLVCLELSSTLLWHWEKIDGLCWYLFQWAHRSSNHSEWTSHGFPDKDGILRIFQFSNFPHFPIFKGASIEEYFILMDDNRKQHRSCLLDDFYSRKVS